MRTGSGKVRWGNDISYGIRVDNSLRNKIKEIARHDRRTMGEEVSWLIERRWLEIAAEVRDHATIVPQIASTEQK